MATDLGPSIPPMESLKRTAGTAGLQDSTDQGQGQIKEESVDGRTWLIQQLGIMERSLQEACFYRALIARFQIDLRQRNLTHLQPRPPAHLLKLFTKACVEWERCRMRVEGYVRHSSVVYTENSARAAQQPPEPAPTMKIESPPKSSAMDLGHARQDVTGEADKQLSGVIDLSGLMDETSGPKTTKGQDEIIDLQGPTTENNGKIGKTSTGPEESSTTAQVRMNQSGSNVNSNNTSILQQMLAAASASNPNPITTSEQPNPNDNPNDNFASPFDPTQFITSLDTPLMSMDNSDNPIEGGDEAALAALNSLSDADLAAWSSAAGMEMGDGLFGTDVGGSGGDLGGIDMAQFAELMKGLPGGGSGGQGGQEASGKNEEQGGGTGQSAGDGNGDVDPSNLMSMDGGGDWNGMDLESMLDSFFQPDQGTGGGS